MNFIVEIKQLKELPKIKPYTDYNDYRIEGNTGGKGFSEMYDDLINEVKYSMDFLDFRYNLKKAFERKRYYVFYFEYDHITGTLMHYPYYYSEYIKNPDNLTEEDYDNIAGEILRNYEGTYLGCIEHEDED